MTPVGQAERRAPALGGLLLLFAFIGAVFWYQDWRYSLPTPRPADLQQPPLRAALALPRAGGPSTLAAAGGDRPVLLHFFNPSCPCSRFNLDHVRALRKAFGDRVEFVAVLQGTDARELEAAFA